jgi:hypothetical protein
MEAKKLEEQEVTQLRILKENTERIIREFGEIKLAQLNLEKREENAEALLEQLKKNEKEIVKHLEDKYGQGSIDIERGLFQPTS